MRRRSVGEICSSAAPLSFPRHRRLRSRKTARSRIIGGILIQLLARYHDLSVVLKEILMTKKWILVLPVVGLFACITPHKRLDNIPLLWKPTSEMKLPPGTLNSLMDTKIQFDAFKDVRKKPEL